MLDKASAVLAALEDGPKSLAGLVAGTGLARATVHRLASALEDHGLVRRDDDGRFALGMRVVALGRAAAEATARHVEGPYRFEVLEGVGHWIPEQAPDRLNALLLDHLRP